MQILNSCQNLTLYFLNQTFQWQLLVVLGVLLFSLTIITTLFKNQTPTTSVNLPKTQAEKLATLMARFPDAQDLLTVQTSPLIQAYTKGFIAPKITISTDALRRLTSKQLEAVFLHELYHVRHFHPQKQSVLHLLSRLFFFLPIMQDIYQYWHAMAEVTADQFAVRSQHTSTHILQALLLIIKQPQQADDFNVVGIHSTEISIRIDSLKASRLVLPYFTVKISNAVISFAVLTVITIAKLYQPHLTLAQIAPNSCYATACVSPCLQSTLPNREEKSQSVAPQQSIFRNKSVSN